MLEAAVGSRSFGSSGIGVYYFRAIMIDGEGSPDISFHGYHESEWRNGGGHAWRYRVRRCSNPWKDPDALIMFY